MNNNKKYSPFTFHKSNDSSETRPEESFSNLTHNDMVGRAVSLADNISDYEQYRARVRQEFGLDDKRLDEVVDEAMRVVADKVEHGTSIGEQGTYNRPSNQPGERPIDAKKAQGKFKAGDKVQVVQSVEPDGGKNGIVEYVNSGGGVKVKLEDGNSETFGQDELVKKSTVIKAIEEVSKISGEFIAGGRVTPGFAPIQPVQKKMPSFKEAWGNIKGYVGYKQAKNMHESTQTPFKQMWKGEVNKAYVKKEESNKARTIGAHWKSEVRKLVAQANKQGIDNNNQVFEYVKDKLSDEAFDTWEMAYQEIENLSHEYNMNKSQVKKDVTSQIKARVQQIINEAVKSGKLLNDSIYDYVFSKIPDNVYDYLNESDIEDMIDNTKRK
jgi:hypothetical protein